MYLGIFVLSCFSFSLIHAQVFTCPTCSEGGFDRDQVLAACDGNIKYEVCSQSEPICEVSMSVFTSGRMRVNRWCTDKETREANKATCKRYGNCPQTAYCTESGCKAILQEKEKEHREVFTCPTCSEGGYDRDQVLAACDGNIKYEVCSQSEPICEVSMSVFTSGRMRVNRWCTDKETREANKATCKRYGNCPQTAYCTESGCKAILQEKEKEQGEE